MSLLLVEKGDFFGGDGDFSSDESGSESNKHHLVYTFVIAFPLNT